MKAKQRAWENERVILTLQGNDLRAWVTHHERGYAVATQDLESGLFFPTVLLFPTAAAALKQARRLTGERQATEQRSPRSVVVRAIA